MTLFAGASLQVSALDGPPGAHLEWTVDEPLTARVGVDGVVGGLRIGSCTLTVRAVTIRKHSGRNFYVKVCKKKSVFILRTTLND